MSKKIQISIPVPCHENWENMTPVEKGRFCASCQKQVIDFSSMSDREVAAFFKRPPSNSTCGRFANDQLNRDIEIPKKRIPWVKYFFQFTLPAFLISMKASAQNKFRKNDIVVVDKKEKPFNDTIILPEVITIGYKPMGKVSPQISAKEVKKDSTFQSAYQNSYMFSGKVGGAMVCVKTIRVVDSLFGKVFKRPNGNGSFKLYPNPVESGSSINIKWKNSETGYFFFQLLNLSGQTVFNKEIWIDDKSALLDVQLPEMTAGNYFVRFISKQSGKSFSQKIIIR